LRAAALFSTLVPVSPVRPATRDDYASFVRLFPELRVPDPKLTLAQFEERMLSSTLVLDGPGGPRAPAAGYAYWQAYGATAHVVHVVVAPAARGAGAGRALMAAVRERAAASGCTRWYLNVKQDNAPAIRLYERCGMAIELESWAMTTAWPALARLEGEAPGDAASPVAPEDDAAVAASLELDAGRIAVLRARPGVVLRGLREGGAWVAFASFDPAFPGIHPVRVARAGLARPLLEALRPHATRDTVHVTVEGDRALRDALLAVGATVTFPFYRMAASL
jgi:ribosomal protein S18 acetylase RimI-like enzyme